MSKKFQISLFLALCILTTPVTGGRYADAFEAWVGPPAVFNLKHRKGREWVPDVIKDNGTWHTTLSHTTHSSSGETRYYVNGKVNHNVTYQSWYCKACGEALRDVQQCFDGAPFITFKSTRGAFGDTKTVEIDQMNALDKNPLYPPCEKCLLPELVALLHEAAMTKIRLATPKWPSTPSIEVKDKGDKWSGWQWQRLLAVMWEEALRQDQIEGRGDARRVLRIVKLRGGSHGATCAIQ